MHRQLHSIPPITAAASSYSSLAPIGYSRQWKHFFRREAFRIAKPCPGQGMDVIDRDGTVARRGPGAGAWGNCRG